MSPRILLKVNQRGAGKLASKGTMATLPIQLIGGEFQTLEGDVLVNGYLRLFLSQDANVAGVGNICSGIFVQIQLDEFGNVSVEPPQYAWGNNQMLPVNTFYKVSGYSASGQLAWGPNNQQIIGVDGQFDVGTWIPNQVISWVPPLQPLELEVNGTANEDQTLLNLTAGSGITITDEGNGEIEISSGATSSGLNIVPISPFSGGAGNLQGDSIVLCMPAGLIQATGTSLKVGLSFYNITSVVINRASIGATIANPSASVGSFTYNYAWTTAPIAFTWPAGSFINSSQVYFSNPVTITVDTNHDYYIVIYLDITNNADTPYLSPGDASQILFTNLGGWVSGDHTADGDASALAGQDRGIFGIQQVVIA
jgi:hypothetical protein